MRCVVQRTAELAAADPQCRALFSSIGLLGDHGLPPHQPRRLLRDIIELSFESGEMRLNRRHAAARMLAQVQLPDNPPCQSWDDYHSMLF